MTSAAFDRDTIRPFTSIYTNGNSLSDTFSFFAPINGTWQAQSDTYRQTDTTGEFWRISHIDTKMETNFSYSARINIDAASPGKKAGIVFRNSYILPALIEKGYIAYLDSALGKVFLAKIDSTVASGYIILDSSVVTLNAGWNDLRVIAAGKTIKVHVNGQCMISISDSSYRIGTIGLATYRTLASFDDLSIQPYAVGAFIPSRMSNELKVYIYNNNNVVNSTNFYYSMSAIPYAAAGDGNNSMFYSAVNDRIYIWIDDGTNSLDPADDVFAEYVRQDIAIATISPRPTLSFALKQQEVYRNCAKTADADEDGIIDGLESAFGCSSRDRDSDDDGLSDGYELFVLGTNPGMVDSDHDGAQDGTECGVTSDMVQSGYWNSDVNMFIYGTDTSVFVQDAGPGKTTNPVVADTDGDGLWDGWEDKDHNNNINGNERGEDMPTESKKAHYLDETERLWANGAVSTIGTNSINQPESDPTNPDSDGDKLLDGADLAKRDCDADDDGLWDGPNVENYTGEMTYRTRAYNSLGTNDGWDTDRDGLSDGLEVSLNESKVRKDSVEFNGYTIWFTDSFTQDTDMATHTNPLLKDSDHDGLEDGEEDANKNGAYDTGMFIHNATTKYWDCDPNDPDTDKDGLADGNEKYWGDDTDGDNLINARDKDSDGDGLEDGNETLLHLTDMVEIDSDSDGLADGQDCTVNGVSYFGEMEYSTDPNVPDTDDDGLLDGVEVGVTWDMAVASGMSVWDADNGTTVTDPLAKDTDGDRLPDGYIEGWNWTLRTVVFSEMNTVAELGEFEDLDCDGMLNPGTWNRVPGAGETNETNASKADTDDDTLPDADEVMVYFTNPLVNGDSDGDGLGDVDEIFNIFAGMDFTGDMDLDTLPNGPGDNDTDGDGLSDGTEVAMGTDPAHNDTDRDKILDGDEPRVVYRTNATNVDAFNSTATYTAWIQVDQNWSDWTWQLVNFTNSGYNLPSSTGKIIGTVIGSTPEGYNITNISSSEIPIWVNVTTNYDTGAYALSSYVFTTAGAGTVQQDWKSPIQAYANSSREIWGGLSPTSNDTDGDGLYDGPGVSWEYSLDSKDHNGENLTVILGISESYAGAPYDIWGDTDNDGSIDSTETWNSCNPINPDTDGDSANDGQEIFGYDLVWMYTNPDGTVTQNYVNGTMTDPLDATNAWRDLDGDGITDYDEIHYAEVYPEIITWANEKRAEWVLANQSYQAGTSEEDPPEFNASEYLSNQFNPFVQENIPPVITRVEIDTTVDWNYWHTWVEACQSTIDVWIMDVGDFTAKVGVRDRNKYTEFSGDGGGIERHFTTTIDIDYWDDSLAEYYVNVTAWDTADNIAYFDKEVPGFFGGIMNFLEDVWNAVVGVFAAAWEMVKAACSFLVEIIKDAIMLIVNGLIDKCISGLQVLFEPVIQALQNFVNTGNLDSNKQLSYEINPAISFLTLIIPALAIAYKIALLFQGIEISESAYTAISAATGGIGTLLKKLLEPAMKSAIKLGFESALMIGIAESLTVDVYEMSSPEEGTNGFYSFFSGHTEVLAVGGAFVEAIMKFLECKKGNVALSRKSFGVGFALTGLIIELLATTFIGDISGTDSGFPLFMLDILACMFAIGGMVISFSDSKPFDKFREELASTTSTVSNALIFLSVGGSIIGATNHAVSGDWV